VQENIPTYIKSGMRLLYRSSTPSATVTAIFRVSRRLLLFSPSHHITCMKCCADSSFDVM
jgi:hypothetical protein